MFPSIINGSAEHYCAFSLPEHGSITFRCKLDAGLVEKEMAANYGEFASMMDVEKNFRVKAYYPIVHTLRSFGSDFAFKDTDLATCPSVRKVFDSFLFMSKWIDWCTKGSLVRGEERHRIDASKFMKEISCLRIEASFVLIIPNEHNRKAAILAPMEGVLGRDINVLFGHNGGNTENVLASGLDFLSVNDWLKQVSKVREMLTGNNLRLRLGWKEPTSRAKQQAECLQSLLGYCCKRTTGAVRSRLWGVVWNENGEKEYPGMLCVKFCFNKLFFFFFLK